jgi:hypothetical protein
LTHGARSSQWNCRALSQVVSEQTGVPLHRESVRVVLKKRLELHDLEGYEPKFGCPKKFSL